MKDRPASFEDLPLVLTLDEVARLMNISRSKVYELVRSNQIKSIRVGSQHRVPKHEIQQYLGLPDQPPPPQPPTFGSLRRHRGKRSGD